MIGQSNSIPKIPPELWIGLEEQKKVREDLFKKNFYVKSGLRELSRMICKSKKTSQPRNSIKEREIIKNYLQEIYKLC